LLQLGKLFTPQVDASPARDSRRRFYPRGGISMSSNDVRKEIDKLQGQFTGLEDQITDKFLELSKLHGEGSSIPDYCDCKEPVVDTV